MFRQVFRVCVLSALVLTGPLPVAAQSYPDRPVTIVVAFGVGGSADRMTRAVSPTLSRELGQPVTVINKKGAGTLLGNRYLLDQPDDGYTILASGFSPYLSNTILEGNAEYAIDDFAYVNFQWFDEDIIALSKRSRYASLPELIEAIREQPKTVKAAVVRGSAGHLMAKLLLEINGIPQHHLNLVTYNGGGLARAAVAGGVVDFIVISAKGTETIRDYVRPLAVVSHQANEKWGVPTLNQALAPLGLRAPVLPGTIRGFATSRAFKDQYPERFAVLVEALKRATTDAQLQSELQRAEIGGRWIGPDASTETMRETFDIFKNYSYLLAL
ncbi:MAG: tripartite tricarboxylate transporter substrate-binding protein [Pseudomonadota bacterium]